MRPVLNPIGAQTGDSLAQADFRRAVCEWVMEIGPTSDVMQITNHPSYRKIVGFGRAAVPYLLREIEGEPSLLVWTLHEITGEDPVPRSARGKIKEMCAAWLSWGREHGLV